MIGTSYGLLIAGDLDRKRLRAALAELVAVPIDAVDVADDGVADRNWKAAVLCTCQAASGDITWILDLYVAEAVGSPPTDEELAARLAAALAVPVLYGSTVGYRPSAHWLAAPDGPPTRARVYEEDDAEDDDGRVPMVIDAVERPVALLPHVRVAAQPEVIRDYRVATPVCDGFAARFTIGPAPTAHDDRVGDATSHLGRWEAFTVRMSSGWPPDGWYPADYYRDALEDRDCLAAVADELPPAAAGPLAEALAGIDETFRAGTREVGMEAMEMALGVAAASGVPGWWWERLPDPLPWRDEPRARPAPEPRNGS
jgi:hypothetical protein